MERSNTPQRRRRSVYQRNRRNQGVLLACLLLATILCFNIVSLLTPDKDYSEQENRKLATAPKLTWTALTEGNYFSDVESYVADQFAARDFWIALQLRFARFMGAKEANGVLLCEDGYLMEAPAAPNAAALQRNLSAIDTFAETHSDANVVMTVVPNAACVLADKLPANVPVRDQKQDIQSIADELSNVKFVDVTAALQAHGQEEIFYRTDHHWTTLGASYAFEAMTSALGINAAGMAYEVYPVSTTFEGTLASRSGCHETRDTVEIWVPKTDIEYYVTYEDSAETTCSLYVSEALEQKDHYTLFFGGNHPRIDITTTAETGKCLLLFKDSYANCFVQFLTPHYEKIIIIDPRYYYGDVGTLMRREQITDVLFLYNANTFLEDTSLADVLVTEE